MLDGLERKLVAVAGDTVAGRAHLDVVQLAGPGDEPAAGRGVVRFAVEEVTPEPGFDRDVIVVSGPEAAPVSRRVLPLRFTVGAHFAVRPAGASPAQRTEARTLLLGDVSALGHALAASSFVSGKAFAAGGDPGFEVKSFALTGGDLVPAVTDEGGPAILRAQLRWEGRATVWPINPRGPEGVVRAIDMELVPVPVALSVLDPVVRQGGTTTVTIDGVGGRRLTGLDPTADEPIALALRVTSDLPPADRGTIEGGTAGTEQGVRIVPIVGPGTTVTYRAPTASLGATAVEFVAVHLAAREGSVGVFLDALPIRLTPVAP